MPNSPGTPASLPRVLLVDNAPDNRLLMSLYLRRSGVEILTAQNGEEALQVAATMKPELVVLDLSVSGMSGYEVCRRIKSNPDTAAIPVVFLTASNEKEERIKALQAGADDFFAKPVVRDEFLIRVKSMVKTRETRMDRDPAGENHQAPATDSESARYEHAKSRKLMDQVLAPGAQDAAAASYQTRFDAVILFADLRGFTRMAEQLSPSQVVTLLNQYFSLLTDVAYRHSGVIFNMAGDSLLVGFGVPFEHKNAAAHAIHCGRDMLSAFEELSAVWNQRYGLETGLGIGVNKGEVIAGNVGSAAYSNFTIIGDAVNIASRLMQRARAGEMLLSERVMEALRAIKLEIDAIPLSPLTLRGRSEPIGLYCVPFRPRIDTRP